MRSSKLFVLDGEGSRQRKEKFIVTVSGICNEEYLDCVLFLTPTSCSELTTQQKQSFNWLTRNLHDTEWEKGEFFPLFIQHK